MSNADQITAMVRDAEARFGRLDLLFNNAGILFAPSVDEFPGRPRIR